jgi:hypothetical protein
MQSLAAVYNTEARTAAASSTRTVVLLLPVVLQL